MNLFFPNAVYHQKELIPLAQSLGDHEQQWLRDFGQVILDWHDDSNFIKVTTSGSTGTPKVIELSKESMKQSALKTGAYFNLGKQSNALAGLPYSFIAGKMMLIRAIVLNWNLHLVPPSSNPLKYTEDKLDFVAMTPHQLSTVITETPSQLHYVDKILLGGAPIPSHLFSKIKSLQPEVYLGYGMTETITHIAVKRINGISPEQTFQALPGIRFDTTNEGCLMIAADHLEDHIVTTDIVKLESDESFEWVGRQDNVINSGGVKIHPEAVEAKLQDHIKQTFFIYGEKDPTLGTRVAICVESSDKSIKDTISRSFDLLDKYERPKNIQIISKFDYTQTGKIQRKETLKKTLE